MELHDTAHTPAMRTAPTRRSTSSPRPQLLRRLLRLLAMVFGEGSATARARWSSSVAAELRRPALRPLRLPHLVPFHGGLARFDGLELGPWRRQLDLVASTSGYGGGGALLKLCGGPIWRVLLPPSWPAAMTGACVRPWQRADPRQAAAAPLGAVAEQERGRPRGAGRRARATAG
ncbi:hypothetical protein PVAP13_4KG403101 [Panicum virgatum]|uniref:Uncharacterized protein n=1 Tax=Panicum virgatum TaxID=38727 RepID=A0A8T0TSH9_PANVG|nr:hypothetical protein PVAP13_4KG403101 [Panicum virgatum]